MRWIIYCSTIATLVSSAVLAGGKVEPLPDVVDFNRDIRPILSDNCFYCHGPDKNTREAGLRLDTREGLLADLGGYQAAVPGKPDDSEIIRRIATSDHDDLMPPPETGKKLSARDIALVRKWIDQGVDFKGHWLYITPERPAVPAVEKAGFVRNDIDRFILARLEAEGFKPSPEADRATLVRRVSFDVTGLPPTFEQVQSALGDSSPLWFERYVDDLLASPHYGERMAMYWLDLVRFADTVGYHGDRPMNIHPYRDYVIRSFNENKPFDQFTAEQLAGDLLPQATLEQKVASGYNRLNMMSEEGGIQDKEYLAKYAIDRVRNVSGVWMGSTMGCAECHDHKFDPFTAKDTYRMEAFFADIKERGYYGGLNNSGNWGEYIQVPSAEQDQEKARLAAAVAQARAAMQVQSPELSMAQAQWEELAHSRRWRPLELVEARGEQGTTFKTLEDGSLLATGPAPEMDDYLLTFRTDLKGITALRLEVLPDASLPGNGPGRAATGNFLLHRLDVAADGQAVKLVDATTTFAQDKTSAAAVIDGNDNGSWAISPQFGQAHAAVFQTAEPLGNGEPVTLSITMRHLFGRNHTIGRFRIMASTGPRPIVAGEMPDAIAAILAIDEANRSPEQRTAVASHFRSITPLLADARQKLAAAEAAYNAFDASIPTTLVTVARDEPRIIRILPRGNWMDDSGEIVEPGVPHFLPQIEKEGRANRLDLAQWLTRRDNPLTSRVFVNRLWKLYFGAGISRNVTDMGSQGEWPTHPELLDWLAVEFMDSGWDIKHMVRLLVTSGAYRQSSLMRPDLQKRDPFNMLYARQSPFRLDAEMIRDQALAVSGLLVPDLYGPSAKPYQPPGYYAYLNFPVREYESDKCAGLYRRGVYTWWQRQYLHPALLAFDAPSREECTAERPRSNTPLQSLVLLNDPTYVEAARVFAERIMREGGPSAEDRVAWAFRQVLIREPEPRELGVLVTLYRGHLAQYQQDPSGAEQLLTVGDRPAAADLDKIELAAWTSMARAILNLNETITRN